MDVGESIDSVRFDEPFIVSSLWRRTRKSVLMLVVENNVISMPNIITAVHCCLTAYYIFNIVYPAQTKSICLLLESVYSMKPSLKMPLHVQSLLNSLSKISV